MSEINFNLYRFQYRSNKKSIQNGDEVQHSIEVHFSADRMFGQPNEQEPQQNPNGEFEVDLSNNGSGLEVGVHKIAFQEVYPYEEDYEMTFLAKSDDTNVNRKPKGNVTKYSNVKDEGGEEDPFEISELILQRMGEYEYEVELSLIQNINNSEVYRVASVNVSGHTIEVVILKDGDVSDLENKMGNELIHLGEDMEIVGVIEGEHVHLADFKMDEY